MKPYFLPKKSVQSINQDLEKLQFLYDEICKAEKIGVPGMEGHKQYCLDMKERLINLKAAYAPNLS